MQLHLDGAGDGARVLSLYDGGLTAVPEWVWERTGHYSNRVVCTSQK